MDVILIMCTQLTKYMENFRCPAIIDMDKAKFITTDMKNDTLMRAVEIFKETSDCNFIIELNKCFFNYIYGDTEDKISKILFSTKNYTKAIFNLLSLSK